MRRPHVYERSVPRARRDACLVPGDDPGQAAHAIIRALPALIATAAGAGLSAVADLLDAARTEAERTGRDPSP